MSSAAAPSARLGRLAAYAGALAAVLGVLVLSGWLCHFDVLGAWPAFTAMKANSCLAVAVAGLSLTGRTALHRWMPLLPLAIASTTMLEWTTGHGLGIDQLLAHDAFTAHDPGRVSPQGSVALALLALALILSASPRGRLAGLGAVLTVAYAGMVLVLELGWVYQAPELTSAAGGAGISAPSAACVGLLAVGLGARHAHRRPLAYLWDRGVTGTVVRRLLPTVVLIPVLLGLARLRAQESGLFGLNLGTAVFTGTMIMMLVAVVTVTARSIHRVEVERTLIARELEAIFDSVPAALTMRDPHGRLVRHNGSPGGVERSPDDAVYFRPTIRDDDRLLPSEVEALATRRPVTSVLVRPDLGREYQVTKFPVYDADGSVLGIGGFAVDITAQREAEREALAAVGRLQAYLDAAPDPTLLADQSGIVRYANHQVTALLGYPPEELVGRSIDELVPSAEREQLRQAYLHHPALRVTGSGLELSAQHRDGRRIAVEVSLGPVQSDGETWVAAAIRDVTHRRETERALRDAEQRARHLADHDPLTGIWNRRRFEGELTALLAEMGSSREPAGALAIIDVDHFKTVNDSEGHHAGDRLLIAVADELARAVRDDGAVSRLGGDEFAVMWCRDGALTTDQRAALLVSAVGRARTSCGLEVTGVSASVGVAAFADLPADERTIRAALIRADEALYAAKRAGRGQYVVYDDALLGA